MAMSHFEQVGEFHTVFDYPVRTEKYLTVFEKEPKLLQSRLAFIREERDEFLEALNNSDPVEMADALCDLNYFAYGSGQCLGIDLDAELRSSGHSNITFTNGEDDFTTDVDASTLPLTRNEIDVRLQVIDGHIDEFSCAINEADFEGLTRALLSIIVATYQLGYFLHFDMDRMFSEVHRSNMTKVCHNMEDAEESVRLYLEEGRYKKPVIRTKDPYFLVYDEDLNKILKNHKWENPNLRQFMGPKYE